MDLRRHDDGLGACRGCQMALPPEASKSASHCGMCGTALIPWDAEPRADRRIHVYAPPLRPTRPPIHARIGPFRLDNEIGRGGMGVVYRATGPDGPVALKILLWGRHAAGPQVERFLRGARRTAGLDHPALVRVLDMGHAQDVIYLTMPLIEGPSLREVLDRRGRLTVDEVLKIGATLARGLHSAHALPLVHRDVKPSNVLLDPFGHPHLVDFGLATELETDERTLTQSNHVLGTPAYLAPELVGGARHASPASDQYALGAVMYEALTGEPPLHGDTWEILRRLATDGPTPLRDRPGDPVPADLRTVIDHAMAQGASDRYATCLDLAHDLERMRAGLTIVARPPSPLRRARLGLARHQNRIHLFVAAAGFAMGISVAAEVVVGTMSTRQGQRRASAADAVLAEIESARPSDLRAGLEGFAANPRWADTPSVARALLRSGDLALADDEVGPAIDAYAASFIGALTPEAEDRALRSLATTFDRSAQYDALGAAIQTLVGRRPGLADDPHIRGWRSRADLGRRDLSRSADVGLPADLGRALRLPHLDHLRAAPLDLDGDGDREAIQIAEGRIQIVDLALEPHVPYDEPWPDGAPIPSVTFPLPGDPPMLLNWSGDGHREGEATLIALTHPPEIWWQAASPTILDAIVADLDGDTGPEIYVGLGHRGRRVVRIDPRPDTGPQPTDLPDLGSDVSALAATDLDADGSPELILAAGAWHAYSIRIVEAGPLSWGPPLRLGIVQDLLVTEDGGLFAAKSDRDANARVFGTVAPFGPPPGIYRLAPNTTGSLTIRDRWIVPFVRDPRQEVNISEPVIADLDGDGQDELIARAAFDDDLLTVVWMSGQPSDQGPAIIRGLRVLAAAQLDDDPDQELLVRLAEDDAETWVLGVGSDRIPALAPPTAPRRPIPPVARRSERAAALWARAEAVAAMGLPRPAAGQLEDLGGTDDTVLGQHARSRAAELWSTAEVHDRAALLYESIGQPEAAIRQRILGHRFDEVDPRSSHVAVDLAAEIEDTVVLSLTRMALVQRAIQIDPVQIEAHNDGIHLTAVSTSGPAATLPFTTSGGRLGLSVALQLERLEWGSGLRMVLEGPDDQRFELAIRGWGGGGLLQMEVACHWPGGNSRHRIPVEHPALGEPWTLTIDASTAAASILCEVEGPSGQRVHHARRPLTEAVRPGDWTLRLEPSHHSGVPEPMTLRARLGHIALSGGALALRPGASAPVGTTGTILSLLAEGDLRAESAMGDLARQGDRELLALLRVHTGGVAGPLQRSIGDDYWGWFLDAWWGAVHAHPEDPEVLRALTTATAGLDAARGTRDQRSVALLLAARGSAWRTLGEPVAARRDLTAAVAMTADDMDPVWAFELTRGNIALAEMDAADGRLASARVAIRRALDISPLPEATRDRMRRDPHLAELLP